MDRVIAKFLRAHIPFGPVTKNKQVSEHKQQYYWLKINKNDLSLVFGPTTSFVIKIYPIPFVVLVSAAGYSALLTNFASIRRLPSYYLEREPF